MDCRETQTLLTAFHDGELPAADRARVEEHLYGCQECVALLADLARADQAAGVPDPGPAYWDRFNARVMNRVEREADGHGWPSAGAGRDATGSVAPADGHGWPSAGTGRDATGSLVPADGSRVTVLRPKQGWIRQQFRYLLPAAAAAALVVMVVRYGGMHPGAPIPTAMDGQVPGQAGTPRVLSPRPTAMDGQVPGQAGIPRGSAPRPTVPPALSKRAAPDSAGGRIAEAEPGSSVAKKAESTAVARPVPPPVAAKERFAAVTREEGDRLTVRSLPSGNVKASRDRTTAPGVIAVPPPPTTFQRAPDGHGWPSAGAGRDATGSVAPADGPSPVTLADGNPSGMQSGRKEMAGAAARMAEQEVSGKAKSDSGMRIAKETSPGSHCEIARTLAERERFREAEVAQRACLAGDLQKPEREKGLVFLAELLDRQARFTEADAVLAEVERLYPQSLPLGLYRQQRPMVQKRRE